MNKQTNNNVEKKYNILAVVKFNKGHALVLDKEPKMTYKRIGHNLIYGTDGLFYSCYRYGRTSENWKAFAGREFTLTMDDGEVVECTGQWWNGGQKEIGEHLGLNIGSATAKSANELKKCYVYCGYEVDVEKYNEFIKSYKGTIFEYYDYEKVLKFNDMRSEAFHKHYKEEKAKKNAIQQAKKHHAELKRLKQLI